MNFVNLESLMPSFKIILKKIVENNGHIHVYSPRGRVRQSPGVKSFFFFKI